MPFSLAYIWQPSLFPFAHYQLALNLVVFNKAVKMIVAYQNRLEADCRGVKGNYIHSQLLLRGIHNTNGSLQFSSYNEESSFQFTCRPNTLIPTPSPVLYEYCRASNGQWVSTSITLFDIHNINGILTYGY